MNKHIFNKNEIVYVPDKDLFGKIIDIEVIGSNTLYMVIFDNGTWDSFFEYELKGDR